MVQWTTNWKTEQVTQWNIIRSVTLCYF